MNKLISGGILVDTIADGSIAIPHTQNHLCPTAVIVTSTAIAARVLLTKMSERNTTKSTIGIAVAVDITTAMADTRTVATKSTKAG